MARYYTIGHEQEVPPLVATVGEEGNGFFYNEGEYTLGTSTSVTRDTAVKRTGLASRAHTRGGTSAIVYSSLNWGLQGLRGYYARIYFRVSSLPAAQIRLAFLAVGGVGSPLLGARLSTGGKIQFYNEVAATQIGSDSAATVAIDTWYRLELYGLTGAGAVDEGELRLDGVTVASTSAVSISDTQIQSFHYGWLTSPGGAFTVWADDVVVNDNQGTVNNSWPGESSILYSNPVSDNSRDPLWTAGAGGTTNLWEAENNNPPAGVASGSATDTSQIKNVTTTDTTQNYAANMETYATAGLDAGDTILNVQAVVQGGTSGASSVQGGLALVGNPFQATEDLKVFDAGAIGTYGVNWQSQLGTAQNLPVLDLAGTPIVRVGRRNTGASELHYCGMTVRVEFVPGTPADYRIAWTSSSIFLAAPLISDFTGADENPLSEGGNWAALNSSAPTFVLKRLSNVAMRGGAGGSTNASYWTPTNFGPDLEAYFTVGGTIGECGIIARIQGEGGASTWDGYKFTMGAASAAIYSTTNASDTQLATASLSWAAGDKFGVRLTGAVLQIWRQASGSDTWTLVVEAVNFTYPSAGKLAPYSGSINVTIDDFYARTL